MRNFLIALILCLPFSISAQKDSSQLTGRLSFGLTGSYDYCHRQIFADDTAGIGEAYEYFRDNEIPDYGFSYGTVARMRIFNVYHLQVGARYTMNKYRTSDVKFINSNGDSIGNGYFAYHNRFISFPIGIQYHPGRRNLEIVGGLFLVPEYAMGIWTRGHYNLPPTYAVNEEFTKDALPELRTFMLTGEAHIGISFRAGSFDCQVLPVARYNLIKQANDTPINRKLWSAGAEFRLIYNLSA